jgi:hypothetical protein
VKRDQPIVEVTEHARLPQADPGGYVERKNGKRMLRLADEVHRTPRSYVLTKTWRLWDWPEEFYERK